MHFLKSLLSLPKFILSLNTQAGILPVRHHHSIAKVFQQLHHTIHIIPADPDVYMYVIVDNKSKDCAAVDTADSDQIVHFLDKEKANLKAILCTSHVSEHTKGNKGLVLKVPETPIYGGDKRVPGLTKLVKSGDQVKVGSLRIKCLFEPKETSGHVCYYLRASGEEFPCAFVGDTLSVGGIGDFPESNLQQIYKALFEVLNTLPDHTFIFPGHEMALNNLKFASEVDPKNSYIKEKLDWIVEQRELKEPTVPSILEEERMYNPFLRIKKDSLQKQCKTRNAKDTLAFLRDKRKKWKVKQEKKADEPPPQ